MRGLEVSEFERRLAYPACFVDLPSPGRVYGVRVTGLGFRVLQEPTNERPYAYLVGVSYTRFFRFAAVGLQRPRARVTWVS